MPLLESGPVELGMACPNFSLRSVDNRLYALKDFADSKLLLVAFICNHCPYVRAIEDRLIALKKIFTIAEFELVGICANDPSNYPDDHPRELKRRWQDKHYGFPYLFDEDQTVAKAFGAVCTPDLFLFDQARKLRYHGRLDDNWQDAGLVQHEELKDAILDLLSDKSPSPDQRPSMGCSIKWR